MRLPINLLTTQSKGINIMTINEVYKNIQKFIKDNNLPMFVKDKPKFPSSTFSVERGLTLDNKKLIGFYSWKIKFKVLPYHNTITLMLHSKYTNDHLTSEVLYHEPLLLKGPVTPEGYINGYKEVLKFSELFESLLGKPVILNSPLVFLLNPGKKFVIAKVKKDSVTNELIVIEQGRVDGDSFKTLDKYHYDFEKEIAYKKEGYSYEKQIK